MELRKSGIVQSDSGSKYAVEHLTGSGEGNPIVLQTTNKRGKETFILGYANAAASNVDGIGQPSSWSSTDYYFYSKTNIRSVTWSNSGSSVDLTTFAKVCTVEDNKITIGMSAYGNSSSSTTCDVYVIDEL